MKINKRLLSFFLAVLMVVSTFGDSVYAITENAKANSTNKKTEIEGKVEGDKEVFTFDLSKFKSTESVAPMTTKAMPARAPRRAPAQWDTQVNITTTGLNGKAFDWTALPNKEFKLIAKWETTDGQKHEKEIATITDTSDAKQFVNVGWPVDGNIKDNASVVTNYNGNVEVRVAIVSGSATGGSGRLTFDVTLTELAEPRANVEYIDPYGRPITDPADLPSDADTMPKVKADELTDVEIELPKKSEQINMRNSGDIDDDELNTAENGLTYKVDGKTTGETVTIDNKEYKLDISAPNAKEIGTIKMVYQKDVLVPPADGDGNPVKPADGYVRLTFDANEKKADGITGTHTAGDYAGKQKSYIDVKQGLNYDNANLQAEIAKLSTTGTKLVGTETKQYAQDAKNPWTPAVPNDTTAVVTATYNAQYTKSKAEQVQELGGLNPKTIKVWKDDPIDWKSGVEPADKNSDAVWALIGEATVTDITVPARDSSNAGKFPGKLKITFDDGSSLEVDKQMLIVSEHVVVIDPNNTDPDAPKEEDLPSGKVKVLFEAKPNGGVESITTKGTTFAKTGTVLQDKDFPQNKDIKFKDGYKGPVTWTPEKTTPVKNSGPGFVKGKGFVFKASATKNTTAEEVTELGGLSPETIKVWVKDPIDWSKGVKATTEANKDKVAALLKDATVTDKTDPARTSDASGKFEGTLLVTFKDTSTIEVAKQMLIVSDNKVVDPQNPDDLPNNKIKVEFAKGTGVTDIAAKELYVKPGTELVEADFPQATVDTANGYKEPATWTPEDKVVTEDNKTFTATAAKDTNFDKNNIVEITFVKDPDKMSYTEGEPLNQDGLKIKLKDQNGNEVTIGKDKLNEYGVTVTPNDGTELTINDHDGKNLIASVKNKDGRTITDNSPGTLTVTKKVEGKPSVTYPDTEVEKGKTETVTPKVTDNDGKPVPENKVGTPTVTNTNDLPEGVTVTPKDNGKVDITVPDGYDGPKDFTVKVTVPVDGKDVESEIKVTVKDKTTPTPQGPSVTYPDTDMDKGDTKTVIPEIKDKKGEPTRPDTTPEVVQPGNGVVVTPHPDGSITVTIPEDYDGPSTIVIPVVVTVDGDEIHTTLTIRVRDNKPVIDYDIPELKIHEYTPTYPVYASVDKKVVEKEVINSHDQYIFGYPDDTIRPDGDMTRAEAIAVVARLQKLDLSDKSSKIYKDTKADMWYNGAINAAFREGYLLEKEGENIRPNDKITRAELAELISHIDKKNNAIAPFDDVKGHKFEAAINQAYGNERIKGYPDGTFKPDNFITRAEVATMLNKLYDRYPDKNFIDANQNLVHNYKDMSYKGHWGYYELVEAYHSHTYLRLKDNMEEWKVIIK